MDTAIENGTGWARMPGDLTLSRRVDGEHEGDDVAVVLADLPYASADDEGDDTPLTATARLADVAVEAISRRGRQIVVVASIVVLAALAYLALSGTVLQPVAEPVADETGLGVDG